MDELLTIVVQYAPAVAIIAYLVYAMMRTIERMTNAVIDAQLRIVDTLERVVRDCADVTGDASP